MKSENTQPDSKSELNKIYDRINSRDFDVTLHCPTCLSKIENFSCPKCQIITDQSVVKLTKGFSFISAAMFLIIPVFIAGTLYALTHSKIGLIIGFLIGIAMGRSLTKMDSQAHQSAKASISFALKLAKEYQKKPETFDAAAYCYLSWLRTHSFPRPTSDTTVFLWRYRSAASVNSQLRQTLLDTLFYKTWDVLVSQEGTRTNAQANLILAIANDSSEQINIAKALWSYCCGSPVLAKLLAYSAPITALALLGNQTQETTDLPQENPIIIRHINSPAWPINILKFAPHPEDLQFLYQHNERLVGISKNKIFIGNYDPATDKTVISFSESLNNIIRICQEWSPDGKDHRGIWFFASDHSYNFKIHESFSPLLKTIGIIPNHIEIEDIKAAIPEKLIFWLSCVRNIIGLVAFTFFIAGSFATTKEMKGNFYLTWFFSCAAIFLIAIIISDNKSGSKETFLKMCGLKNTKNFTDPMIKVQ